ncbi:MAG: diguanylate cyclase [Planctomycetes bacterium]|nr:diguanylate cyclase [Planctomycetota bacterium]
MSTKQSVTSPPSQALEFSKNIVDGLQDGALILDTSFQVIYSNGPFTQLISEKKKGFRKSQIYGKCIFDLFSHNPENDLKTAQKCLSSKKTIIAKEVPIKNPKGKEFHIIQTQIPILNHQNNNECVGIIAIFRNVTDEVKLQQRYRKLLAREKERADELEILVQQRTKQLTDALDDVVQLSRIDPLTGLLNRRAFKEKAEPLISVLKRHKRTGALIICDLDLFKNVNDQYGHQAGDVVLIESAKALRESVRSEDVLCRCGGEEFLLLLSETKEEFLFESAERCRKKIASMPINKLVPGKKDPQTISMGCALIPHHGTTIDALVKVADKALYEAKHQGRNKVIIAKT